MKSLQDVFDGIAAFVKDMKELGVDVDIAIAGDPMKLKLTPNVTLLAVVKMKLKEEDWLEYHEKNLGEP